MYYNRTLSKSFSGLLEPQGELRWLFDYVKNHPELDFLIGKNNANQWISIYRGLSRVLTITANKNLNIIKLDGADAYKKLSPDLYGKRNVSENFLNELARLVTTVSKDPYFDIYYNNKKEGYYQNELSRKYGICGKVDDPFVIIDKEVVIGYKSQKEKDEIYGKIRSGYKILQKEISYLNPKRYGKNLEKKAIGDELDFLALDRDGNLLLIEYKHGTNTSGIYLSPLQIGMYYDLFNYFSKSSLIDSVYEMIEQKKKIGLINSKWSVPKIIGIFPILIISDLNYKSSAKIKYKEIISFVRERIGPSFLKEIRTYNYTTTEGITTW